MSKSDVMQTLLFNTLNSKKNLICSEWDKLQDTIHDKYEGDFNRSLNDVVAFINSANIKDLQVITLASSKRLIELACNYWAEKSPRRAILLYRAAIVFQG